MREPHENPRYDTYRDSWNGHVKQVVQQLIVFGDCLIILNEQYQNKECGDCDGNFEDQLNLATRIFKRQVKEVPKEIPFEFLKDAPVKGLGLGGPYDVPTFIPIGPRLPIPIRIPVF